MQILASEDEREKKKNGMARKLVADEGQEGGNYFLRDSCAACPLFRRWGRAAIDQRRSFAAARICKLQQMYSSQSRDDWQY